jgi:hypothetical protein
MPYYQRDKVFLSLPCVVKAPLPVRGNFMNNTAARLGFSRGAQIKNAMIGK